MTESPPRRTPHQYARGELVVVIDSIDLDRSAAFWTAVLGYVSHEGTPFRSLIPASGDGIEVLLQQVDDVKVGKNRLHIDLRTPDLEAEVARVTSLGATRLTAEPIIEDDWRWHVLADPAGNEFCVLQPPA
ncbi:MAG TPA: VOC family protein [Streptosporangiaceae bacterium]|nr:VOC family protein [Streptosporangiaceae bacterium]